MWPACCFVKHGTIPGINNNILTEVSNYESRVSQLFQKSRSNLKILDRWHEASSILKTHKYHVLPHKILSPWQRGAQDLCTSSLESSLTSDVTKLLVRGDYIRKQILWGVLLNSVLHTKHSKYFQLYCSQQVYVCVWYYITQIKPHH